MGEHVENNFLLKDVDVQGQALLGGVKFDIRTVLLKLVPTLIGLVTELITTGKIDVKRRDSGVILGLIALLRALLEELEGGEPV